MYLPALFVFDPKLKDLKAPQPTRTFRILFFFAYDASIQLPAIYLSGKVNRFQTWLLNTACGSTYSLTKEAYPPDIRRVRYQETNTTIAQCDKMAGVKVCWQKVIIITQQK